MENGIEKIREIELIEARPEDAEGITNVLYKAWLATYPNEEVGITIDDIEDSYKDAFTEEKIKSQQEKIANTPENIRRIIAKSDDLVVGVATMIRNEDNNELRTMYVLPEFHGKGIGTKLWDEVKQFTEPSKDIIVKLVSYNQNAIEFYRKLGFVDTGKRWSDEQFKMKSGVIIPQMEMVIKAEKDPM